MTRFDRYMLSQFMVLFGFFALVLVLVLWINRAVRMFDRLISDGQTAWVFLEFTALTLPGVIGAVLPIAAFAGAVYVANRLSTESELTVMQATGYSPWRLARPVFVYGVIVALLMSLLSHILVPASLGQLRIRKAEVSQNITAKLLNEGEFLHPAPGITFYIRDITSEGALQNVFLSDRRNPDAAVIYTSNNAYLVQQGGGTKLVMLSGLAQSLKRKDNRLFTTHFDDLSYDISSLISRNQITLDNVVFAETLDMLHNPEAVAQRTQTTTGAVLYELHGRFSQALMCIVAALIGFATLLLGSYSRFGVWWQIVSAFLLLVMLKLIESSVAGVILAHARLWPLVYLPALVGGTMAVLLLFIASNPGILYRFPPSRIKGAAQ